MKPIHESVSLTGELETYGIVAEKFPLHYPVILPIDQLGYLSSGYNGKNVLNYTFIFPFPQ